MDQQTDQPLIHATLRATYPPDASEPGTQLIQLAIRRWHHVTIVTFLVHFDQWRFPKMVALNHRYLGFSIGFSIGFPITISIQDHPAIDPWDPLMETMETTRSTGRSLGVIIYTLASPGMSRFLRQQCERAKAAVHGGCWALSGQKTQRLACDLYIWLGLLLHYIVLNSFIFLYPFGDSAGFCPGIAMDGQSKGLDLSRPNTPEKVLLTLGAEIESVSRSIDYIRSIWSTCRRLLQ